MIGVAPEAPVVAHLQVRHCQCSPCLSEADAGCVPKAKPVRKPGRLKRGLTIGLIALCWSQPWASVTASDLPPFSSLTISQWLSFLPRVLDTAVGRPEEEKQQELVASIVRGLISITDQAHRKQLCEGSENFDALKALMKPGGDDYTATADAAREVIEACALANPTFMQRLDDDARQIMSEHRYGKGRDFVVAAYLGARGCEADLNAYREWLEHTRYVAVISQLATLLQVCAVEDKFRLALTEYAATEDPSACGVKRDYDPAVDAVLLAITDYSERQAARQRAVDPNTYKALACQRGYEHTGLGDRLRAVLSDQTTLIARGGVNSVPVQAYIEPFLYALRQPWLPQRANKMGSDGRRVPWEPKNWDVEYRRQLLDVLAKANTLESLTRPDQDQRLEREALQKGIAIGYGQDEFAKEKHAIWKQALRAHLEWLRHLWSREFDRWSLETPKVDVDWKTWLAECTGQEQELLEAIKFLKGKSYWSTDALADDYQKWVRLLGGCSTWRATEPQNWVPAWVVDWKGAFDHASRLKIT